MAYRKTLKVVLSATRLNLDKLPWLHFDWSESEIVGVATLKALDKNIAPEQLERAGYLVVQYLEAMTGTVEHACENAGPFVFSLKRRVDFLAFIRDFRKEFMKFGQCDHLKLEFKFQ